MGVEIAEFVFGEVDAEIVRTVFEETEEVFDVVAGDGRVVVYIVASIVRSLGDRSIPEAEVEISLSFSLRIICYFVVSSHPFRRGIITDRGTFSLTANEHIFFR